MAFKTTLSDLRNGIEEIHREMMRQQRDGEASNAAVVAKVRRDKVEEVALLTDELVDIALIKLLNEVSSRKGVRNFDAGTLDLFDRYRGIPKSVTILKGKKKSTSLLTIVQADLWLKARMQKPADDRHEPFRRMVDDCRPFQRSEDDTLATMMERRAQAERLPTV
ncbi:hypothetical protein [Sphingomonas sp. ID0503]|uniref:hypothetical protein n=1 Tax=Sphingomonas sp. ID0503 TaxID=3399691 RepID=UPI003AFAFB06